MNTSFKPDALIFDMDGTLWDAVETYTQGFNDYFEANHMERRYTRADQEKYMGWERDSYLAETLPEFSSEERLTIYQQVVDLQYKRIQKYGGQLYEGVEEGLSKLSQQYSLFIVSNCAEFTIQYFVNWAGIQTYITDSMAHGSNLKSKSENIRYLIEKHQLKSPVYIGDTASDAQQSQQVPLPFVFVDYGFGYTDQYHHRFSSFGELTSFYLSL